jgi:putative spermidine/putrescine transport system permease protein
MSGIAHAETDGTLLPNLTSRTRQVSAWFGVMPFFVFAIAFLILPASFLVVGSFQDPKENFTLANFVDLFQPEIASAYWLSMQISVVTAVAGGLFGFMLAYATILGGLPRWVRSALMTFSGVASNFSGVPLAFAFIATLGRTGFMTAFLRTVFGLNIYEHGFNLYSFVGLSITYMYFQFPLMVLMIAPALDGLKREWREASENLGATPLQYWRYVALPIILPSLLGAMILLFGNAFGAYATAFALTGGTFGLATILIGRQIRGEVLQNPGLGYAVAIGMVIIMTLSVTIYSWLQRKTERWLR